MTTIKELMDLRGRRALITGAGGGLGRVMADTLAELGADLILVESPGLCPCATGTGPAEPMVSVNADT